MKVYKRTENGTTTFATLREGLDEINHAMTAGKRDVRTMSSITRTDYDIQYKDGRHVRLVQVEEPAEQPEQGPTAWTGENTRIVTIKGKRYAAGPIRGDGARPYVHYWSELNGEAIGATRTTDSDAKSGTVGRAIWDAVSR